MLSLPLGHRSGNISDWILSCICKLLPSAVGRTSKLHVKQSNCVATVLWSDDAVMSCREQLNETLTAAELLANNYDSVNLSRRTDDPKSGRTRTVSIDGEMTTVDMHEQTGFSGLK